jgi:hypothetical protein
LKEEEEAEGVEVSLSVGATRRRAAAVRFGGGGVDVREERSVSRRRDRLEWNEAEEEGRSSRAEVGRRAGERRRVQREVERAHIEGEVEEEARRSIWRSGKGVDDEIGRRELGQRWELGKAAGMHKVTGSGRRAIAERQRERETGKAVGDGNGGWEKRRGTSAYDSVEVG